MKQKFSMIGVVCSTLALAGCETASEALTIKREPLTLKQQAALAVDEDYGLALRAITANGKAKTASSSITQIVPAAPDDAQTTSAVAPPVPVGNSFGPRVGQYYLADDYVVYRHARPQAAPPVAPPPTVVSADSPAPEPAVSVPVGGNRVELTYFLVSPEGKIDDYATGSLVAAQTVCIQIISGQANICDDTEKLSADFDLFDSAMLTSKGLSTTSWNVSENAVLPAPVATNPVLLPAAESVQ